MRVAGVQVMGDRSQDKEYRVASTVMSSVDLTGTMTSEVVPSIYLSISAIQCNCRFHSEARVMNEDAGA